MRTRTVILVLAAVFFFNGLVVLGVWLWVSAKATKLAQSSPQTHSAAEEVQPDVEQPRKRSTSIPAPLLSLPDAKNAWAEIESPRNGEAVPRRFSVSGRCGPVPAGNRLMLVIDSGSDVYSPKSQPVTVNGENFEGAANEFGAPVGGTFSLCVFLVSDEGAQMIADWHAQNKVTGKYPPFRGGVPGGVSLARIKLRVAR